MSRHTHINKGVEGGGKRGGARDGGRGGRGGAGDGGRGGEGEQGMGVEGGERGSKGWG